ncbi:MAG TPA: PhzF family phenazine biosynthesis protein [Candidatus Binatus sp.]|nr:PhzF family phenazine biosynthesis protein [Candidatus Binatus sp.]
MIGSREAARHNFRMSSKTPFILVDVFTSRPFGGNQLAVFTDAATLSASQMQELAHEMNFSESTFVMPPDSSGARRVRIFTPKHEMPMAGHPTVGTTWVLASRGEIALEAASVDATLQLGIGPVTVTVESARGKPNFVWMAHREPEFGAKRDDRERIAEALGITAAEDIRDDLPIQIVSTGVPFLFVPIRTLDALAKCAPNAPALAALFQPGEPILPIYIFVANESGEFAPRSRMFAPHDGVAEDPATGGASAPFGAYAATYGLIKPAPKTSFLIQQGVEMGRPSEIRVEVARKDSGALAIRIGGRCAIVGEGFMFL